jgi:prolyl-tRNA editing enzyme YbaK/EbsC (Cys-tRNA(Pro) deacylase)
VEAKVKEAEEKLKQYLEQTANDAEHLSFDQPCHSVNEAAEAVGGTPDDLVKNICMIDSNQNLIVAIVKGEDRASTSRVAKALKTDRPRIANPEEILDLTGFPCGGTSSFGFSAIFLVDPKVLDKKLVYTGGGSETSLVHLSSATLLELNQGKVARVRK